MTDIDDVDVEDNVIIDDDEIEVVNDTLKGTTFGDPDGSPRFVETLGCYVPTYIDPRFDLLPDDHRARNAIKRLDYHVPFQMRGDYKIEDWPIEYRAKADLSQVRTNDDGWVLCSAVKKQKSRFGKGDAGDPCSNKAVNRCRFCRQHGGGLHPADKKLSVKTIAPMPQDRIDRLDRVSKFMQGLLDVGDLADDEISGGYVRDSSGRPVQAKALGRKFEEIITKELQTRLNNYLKGKAPRMLEVVTDIAENDLNEPADRLKAAIWAFERVGGKTPDVVLSGGLSEKPYSGILDTIESGKREDYREGRKQIESSRVESGVDSGILGIDIEDEKEYLEVEEVDESEVELISPFAARSNHSTEEQSSVLVAGSGNNGSERSDIRPDNSGTSNGSRVIDYGTGITSDSSSTTDSDSAGTVEYVEASISEQQKRRQEAERIRKARAKAKQRRFAARAVGATNLNDVPLLIEWRIITDVKSADFGRFKMKLIHPDQVTEAVLARVAASNDPTRQQQALADAAARVGVA